MEEKTRNDYLNEDSKQTKGNKSKLNDGLSLLLGKANHEYECLQESLAFDNSAPEKREYRRGQRDAYVSIIENIKEAIKG